MKAKKGLQKFTESEAKFKSLLSLPEITYKYHETLTPKEKKQFDTILTDKLNSLKGVELDNFLKKIDPIFPEDTKNQLWERNHNKITAVISNLMQEQGRMPSSHEIAERAELSRQTVHKHLKEYMAHDLYKDQLEQFRFMSSKVLAKVFKYAVNGDIRACKLYLDAVGNTPGGYSNNTLIQNQNNYIQINGTVVNQEAIKQLSPAQLNTLESLFKIPSPQLPKGTS